MRRPTDGRDESLIWLRTHTAGSTLTDGQGAQLQGLADKDLPAAQEQTAHFGVEVALANLTRPRVAAALDAGAPPEMLPETAFKRSIAIMDKAMGAGIGDMMRQVPPLPTLSPGVEHLFADPRCHRHAWPHRPALPARQGRAASR